MPSRKEDKCRRAKERQEVRDKRSPKEQLERLDDLLGEGKGAVKERTRLLKKIEGNEEPVQSLGALSPEENVAHRFAKIYMDNQNIRSIGLVIRRDKNLIRVLAEDPSKLNLPETFENVSIVIEKVAGKIEPL